MSKRDPSIVEAMQAVQDHLQVRVRTVVPAEIVSFTAKAGTIGPHASVQPQVRVRLKNGDMIEPKPLQDCPVIFPGGAGWSLTWTPVKGDKVALLVSDRELGRWRQAGKMVDPADGRRHNMADAIVLPGLSTDVDTPVTPTGNMVLSNDAGDVKIELQPAKVVVEALTVELGAGALESLVKGNAFKLLYNAHTHTAPAGGGPTSTPVVPMDAVPGSHLSTKVKTS